MILQWTCKSKNVLFLRLPTYAEWETAHLYRGVLTQVSVVPRGAPAGHQLGLGRPDTLLACPSVQARIGITEVYTEQWSRSQCRLLGDEDISKDKPKWTYHLQSQIHIFNALVHSNFMCLMIHLTSQMLTETTNQSSK